jgi:meiotically up-regulated gene 157 (Mug157) protein
MTLFILYYMYYNSQSIQPGTFDSPTYLDEDKQTEQTEQTEAAKSPFEKPIETPTPKVTCVGYMQWMNGRPGPMSTGKRKFPYMRPPPECRTFKLPALESLITRMKGVIKDPDMYRLFENSYPITLDTMVKWRGYAEKEDAGTGNKIKTDEELTYVITGDIDAMWLRDSASQIYSYLPLLEASTSPDSLASLWRGLINSHSRYINISPYCHSFQPPPESGIPPTSNGAYHQNHPMPAYDPKYVFDCKWELDSLASFLQISSAYYKATGDVSFFGKYSWVSAVKAAVKAAGDMRKGTYDKDGKVLPSAWTFTGWTNRGSETLTNDGLGNPVRENGMVRTAFRPSDDACIFQLLTPANMMWAKYLEEASVIAEKLGDKGNAEAAKLTAEMRNQAAGIRKGIDRDAVVHHRDFGDIFAYEVDGFGGANLMDDANVPSLLAMPLWDYSHSDYYSSSSDPTFSKTTHKTGSSDSSDSKTKHKPVNTELNRDDDRNRRRRRRAAGSSEASSSDKTSTASHDYDKIYRNTRAFALSDANPYYAWGPDISAVGGPHLGPGKAWPMAAIIAGLTAFDPATSLTDEQLESEVAKQLGMVLDSTAGEGVIHESVNSWNNKDWTRPWFGWANGLFGELILRIEKEEKARGITGQRSLLQRSWQDERPKDKQV